MLRMKPILLFIYQATTSEYEVIALKHSNTFDLYRKISLRIIIDIPVKHSRLSIKPQLTCSGEGFS